MCSLQNAKLKRKVVSLTWLRSAWHLRIQSASRLKAATAEFFRYCSMTGWPLVGNEGSSIPIMTIDVWFHSLIPYQKPPKWRDLFSKLFLQQVAIRQCLGRSNEFTLVPTYTKLYAYFEGHPGILSPHPWGLGIFHRFHWKPNHPQIPLTSTGPTPASQETRVMENLLIMGMTFAGKKHQNHGRLLFLGPFLLFFLLLLLLWLLLLLLLLLSSCFVDRGNLLLNI